MSNIQVDNILNTAGTRTIPVTTGIPQLFRIADASDIVLTTCVSGGTRVGGSFVANIPTNGKIRITVDQVQLNATSGMGSIGLAIEVNGSVYFLQHVSANYSTTPRYVPGAVVTNPGWGLTYAIFRGGSIASTNGGFVVDFDVGTIGCATGSQPCYVRLGHSADTPNGYTDVLTVKGTATPTRIHVEVIGV